MATVASYMETNFRESIIKSGATYLSFKFDITLDIKLEEITSKFDERKPYSLNIKLYI